MGICFFWQPAIVLVIVCFYLANKLRSVLFKVMAVVCNNTLHRDGFHLCPPPKKKTNKHHFSSYHFTTRIVMYVVVPQKFVFVPQKVPLSPPKCSWLVPDRKGEDVFINIIYAYNDLYCNNTVH